MFKSIAAAIIAATSVAYNAPTQEERESVKRWDDTMKYFGRDYEMYKANTDDGWTLTLFRILPASHEGIELNAGERKSVLFQHGATMDGTAWMEWLVYDESKSPKDLPVFMRLADEGYDVWLGSNRATKYSNVHSKYPDADDPSSPNYKEQNFAKYDSGFYEFGQYDVPAMLDTITEVSGNEKVTYVGYSQGTAQLFYGLATETPGVASKLDKAILLAPCLYTTSGDYTPIELYE